MRARTLNFLLFFYPTGYLRLRRSFLVFPAGATSIDTDRTTWIEKEGALVDLRTGKGKDEEEEEEDEDEDEDEKEG